MRIGSLVQARKVLRLSDNRTQQITYVDEDEILLIVGDGGSFHRGCYVIVCSTLNSGCIWGCYSDGSDYRSVRWCDELITV